jgi:hypothetical protein
VTGYYLLTEGDASVILTLAEFLDDGGEVFDAETREKIRALAPGEEYRGEWWTLRHLTEQEMRAFGMVTS